MNFLYMVYYIVLEIITIIKFHILGLFLKPDSKWKVGSKNDVLLVHGFGGNFTFLLYIAQKLNSLGYKIHVITNTHMLGTAKNEARIVSEYIQKNNLSNFILIGHSKGGIVLKYLLETNQAVQNNCKLFISICSPFNGTVFAYLSLFNLVELTPRSSLIKTFVSTQKSKVKHINFYARLDELVIPNKNAILDSPNTENIRVNVIGHTNILQSWVLIKQLEHFMANC